MNTVKQNLSGPVLTEKKEDSKLTLLLKNPAVFWGGIILLLLVALSIMAPVLSEDPSEINPIQRLKAPSGERFLGTDSLGRDLFSRVIHGSRISLITGLLVAALAVALGLVIGMLAGYIRILDTVIMRVMDGLMSIPGILLAIALVSLSGASLTTVVIAITIPEIPRVVRLVRSIVLSVREEPYIEAAICVGTRLHKILFYQILPNTVAPIVVQATYICGSAMLTEAILGFLGAGIPPETPSWGNIMAEGRTYFQIAPWIVFFSGIGLALTVLSINIIGDGLRDTLDPRISRKI